MNSWKLYGHDWAVEMLYKHVASGSARHAYLFAGPDGLGRRTLALRLAQALNCEQPAGPGQPCFACRTCNQFELMQHPDLMVVQAASEGGTLKVEQVREVQKFLSLRPFSAGYKVALFLRFEEANVNAQNALLKTLEEAPSYGVLLLTADNPEQLLPTIVSRCEVLRMRPMPPASVKAFLQERQVGTERAALLASLSGGRPGLALQLAGDEKAFAFRAEKLADLKSMLGAKRRERFAYAEKLAKDKENFRQTLFTWLGFWRDVLLAAGGAPDRMINVDWNDEIRWLGASLNLPAARQLVQATEKAIERLDRNVNARLLAEVFLMEWPVVKD